MGYRSDVAIAIKLSDKEKFEAAITDYDNKIKLENKFAYTVRDLLDDADECYYGTKGDYIIVCWTYIKWYDDFAEVIFFNKAITEDYGIKRDLLRVGEEIGDIEEDYQINSNAFGPITSQSIQFYI